MYAFAIAISMLTMGQASPAEKNSLEISPEQMKKWEDFYRSAAATYSITRDGNDSEKLEMRAEPVLHWSNPIRGNDTRGSVFVWTYNGRAEVVGTVFSFRTGADTRKVKHSFHSLSLAPLAAERNMHPEWSMKVPGIKPVKIPEAPTPAKTRAFRLVQMRELAAQFSAETRFKQTDQELRLLPQPLYRYEKSSGEVIDGALFTFVIGTDPELMLVIEDRGTDEESAWYFGAGRFTDLQLKLRHNNKVLWTYEEGLDDNEDTPYVSREIEVRPKNFPD